MNRKAHFLRKLTVCPIWDQRIILVIVSVAVVFQTIKMLMLIHLINKCIGDDTALGMFVFHHFDSLKHN